MENKDNLIRDLFSRLEQLRRQQKFFEDEIQSIYRELKSLKEAEKKADTNQEVVHTATEKDEPKSASANEAPQ